MFIHGPKIAGPKAARGSFSVLIAKAVAIPPFCSPTSIETVRQLLSSNRARRAP